MTSTDRLPRGVFRPRARRRFTPISRSIARAFSRIAVAARQGADGLAVFGTTSEANSLSIGERMQLLEHLIDHGIRADVLMPGTGCCALPDTVALTRHAVEHGCIRRAAAATVLLQERQRRRVLRRHRRAVQRVADKRLRIYLYHIPPMAGVGFSLRLIERLLKAFPGMVVGIKDSSGDWKNTASAARAVSRLRGISRAARLICSTACGWAAQVAFPRRPTSMSRRCGADRRAGLRPRPTRCSASSAQCAPRCRSFRWSPPTRRSFAHAQRDRNGTSCVRRWFAVERSKHGIFAARSQALQFRYRRFDGQPWRRAWPMRAACAAA